jgi:predicted dehydrogenase
MLRPARRRQDLRVEAVAARDRDRAVRFAAEHGIPRVHESYPSLLADPDIDLVYVALPPSEHARWSIAALEAGKHVLCEKPFGMDAQEARSAVEIARRTGLHLIEAFHDHYHPALAELQDVIDSGALGTITSIEASFTADNPYSPTSLRHVPELGGGALMDLGCYPVHWLRSLSASEPTVLSATFQPNPLGADLTIDARLAIETGPMAGATARLHASMAPGVPFAAPVAIKGERGELRIDNLVLPHEGHRISSTIDGVQRTWTVAGSESFDHELDAVVHALTGDVPAATEGEHIIANMALLDAIYVQAGVARPADREETRA